MDYKEKYKSLLETFIEVLETKIRMYPFIKTNEDEVYLNMLKKRYEKIIK